MSDDDINVIDNITTDTQNDVSNNVISIRFTVVPGSVRDLALNEGATVRDAIDAAEIEFTRVRSTGGIMLNSGSADHNAVLSDGDNLMVSLDGAKANT